MENEILSIKNLSFYYNNNSNDLNNKSWIKIFKDISIDINKGNVIGIAGKSGCGKTTLAKSIVNYHKLSGLYTNNKDYKINGSITYNGNIDILSNKYKSFNPPPIQMVFQDPRTSLNMKMSLDSQLKESFKLNFKNKNLSNKEIENEINRISVKFKIQDNLHSTPEQLSGGQRRRFGLAKVLSCNPKVIIADEPVSSLDVSIKRDIMNVLFDLKKQGITIVIISHDISLLKNNSDYIYIMENGSIVEKWNTTSKPLASETKKLNNDSSFVNEFITGLKNSK